jgi:hypothetical protein
MDERQLPANAVTIQHKMIERTFLFAQHGSPPAKVFNP